MANSARIDELRQKFDENPRRYFAPLANEYRKAGDLEQAISICQEYLPQQPGHMSGHIVYGQALYESDRLDEAKAVFETALSLDPENLIALRHLGDIARQAGDVGSARDWYQRALEVDPRNDEISALVESLAGVGAATPEAEPGTASIMEPPPVPFAFETTADSSAEHSELEVERSEEALSMDSIAGWQERAPLDEHDQLEPVPPPPAPAPPEASADELLDLDDFSLGDLTLASTQSASTESAPADAGSAGNSEGDAGFTLEQETELFDSDAFAEAATPPLPDIELATDINLGLIDDGTAETTSTPPAASLGGLETFEAGTLSAGTPEAPSLEVESFFDLPPRPASAEAPGMAEMPAVDEELPSEPTAEAPAGELAISGSAPIDGGHEGQETPAEASEAAASGEAFVTETMAELYIQQGHLESALDIYRKLVEQRPGEPELRARLRAIEARLFGAPQGRESETGAAASVTSRSGPTIREFLTALISQRGASGNAGRSSNGSSNETSGPSGEAPPPRTSVRATPNSGETVSGSIDALFSGAIATASDSMAAITLSDAFASGEPESQPLEGTPAHRADDELSLDHVFRSNSTTSANAGRDDFSFDEFFAEEAGEGTGASPADSGSSGSGTAPDDIAQFNAWLNGLKKT